MLAQYQFTVQKFDTYWCCYVWAVAAHGKGTRRRIVTKVYQPPQEHRTPAGLLRAFASELDKPVDRRWTPA